LVSTAKLQDYARHLEYIAENAETCKILVTTFLITEDSTQCDICRLTLKWNIPTSAHRCDFAGF